MLKGYGKLYFKFIIKVHVIWLWFVANITPALTNIAQNAIVFRDMYLQFSARHNNLHV